MDKANIETLADSLAAAVFERIAADGSPVKSSIREVILAGLAVEALAHEPMPASLEENLEEKPQKRIGRRFGRFFVGAEPIPSRDEAMQRLLVAQEGCAVVRCEHLYNRDAFEILAFHPDFDETPEGRMPPEYDVVLHTSEDGSVTRTFARRD